MKRVRVTALISNFGAFVKKVLRWFGERLKDLFYATGNQHAELGRVVTGVMTGLIAFSVWWNSVKMNEAIQLGELLNGLAAFVAAAGLGIGFKDWVRTKIQGKIDDITNDP